MLKTPSIIIARAPFVGLFLGILCLGLCLSALPSYAQDTDAPRRIGQGSSGNTGGGDTSTAAKDKRLEIIRRDIVRDDFEVADIISGGPNDGDILAVGGTTYRLYDVGTDTLRAYQLDGDGNPLGTLPADATPTNANNIDITSAPGTTQRIGQGNNGGSANNPGNKVDDGVGGVPLTLEYLGGVVDDCLACELLSELMIAVDGIGTAVTPLVRNAANGLLGIVLMVVIIFNLGKLFMPFSMLEASRLIYGRIVSQTGMVLISTLFLTSFVNYWNIVFVPPVTAGVNYVDQLMEAARAEINSSLARNVPQNGYIFDVTDPDNPITGGCDMDTIVSNGGPQSSQIVTAQTLGNSIECLTRDMQGVLAIGVTASLNAMMTTASDDFSSGRFLETVASFPATIIAIISGAILFLVYAPAYLSFPLKIADVVVRWAILGVISPVLIAAFAFPATRHMTFAGLRGLFQSVMELVMIGVAIALGSFTIVAITNDIDMETSSLLLNGVLFWRFFFAGLITTMMIGKMKSFALAFTFPVGSRTGMDVDVAGKAGDSLQGALDKVTGNAQTGIAQGAAGGANALGKAPGAVAKGIAARFSR